MKKIQIIKFSAYILVCIMALMSMQLQQDLSAKDIVKEADENMRYIQDAQEQMHMNTGQEKAKKKSAIAKKAKNSKKQKEPIESISMMQKNYSTGEPEVSAETKSYKQFNRLISNNFELFKEGSAINGEAFDKLISALKKYPDNKDFTQEKITTLIIMERVDEAKSELEEAIEIYRSKNSS